MSRYTVRITQFAQRWTEVEVEADNDDDAERKAWIRGGDFDEPFYKSETAYEIAAKDGVRIIEEAE